MLLIACPACARQYEIRGRAVQPRLAARQPKFRKLFVGGLDTRVADAEFLQFFQGFGEVVGSQVVQYPLTGASRGFGFITFAEPSVATRVLSLGERTLKIRGKAVHIKRATPPAGADTEARGSLRAGRGRGASRGSPRGGPGGPPRAWPPPPPPQDSDGWQGMEPVPVRVPWAWGGQAEGWGGEPERFSARSSAFVPVGYAPLHTLYPVMHMPPPASLYVPRGAPGGYDARFSDSAPACRPGGGG